MDWNASFGWPEVRFVKRLVLASVVAVAGLGGPAMAADGVPPPTLPVVVAPAVAPPVAFDWTGPYAGAFGGYGFGYSSATSVAPFGAFDEGVAVTLALQPRGILGGITVGYNHEAGALLFGIEGAGGYLNLNDTLSITTGIADPDTDNTLTDDTGTVAYGWYATLGGRLGVTMDRTLLFATAGGIITQYSAVYGDLDNPGPALDAADMTVVGGTQFGYVLGAGAEFAFDANWTAKLEYNYFNLGADTTGNLNLDTYSHRNSAHLIKFGLNYLFGY